MADKKISALTAATTPLAGTEVLPIVQSGSTVKVANNDLRPKQIQSNATSGVLQIAGPAAAATRVMTVPDANFTAARTDAAQSFTGDQTFATGNAIQGAAGKGFNFAANSAASGMTSQLLNWYEEGTFTPIASGTVTAGAATYTTQFGHYTRIGRQVTILIGLAWSAHTGTGDIVITGLPFNNFSASNFSSVVQTYNLALTAGNFPLAQIQANSAQILLLQSPTGGGAWNPIPMDTAVDYLSISTTYFV